MGVDTRIVSQAVLLVVVAALAACMPPGSEPPSEQPPPPRLHLEPDGAPTAAPPVLRIRIRHGTASAEDLHLVEGEVRSAHLAQFARDDVSVALSERIVPALRWVEGEEVVLAPTQVLAPGTYHAVVGPLRWAQAIEVVDDALPHLNSVWRSSDLAIWCGEGAWPPMATKLRLAPGDVEATLAVGASPEGIGRHCVHLSFVAPADAVMPPPALLGLDGVPYARLEPVALEAPEEAPVPERMLCRLGELPVGPGCVSRIDDDRLRIDAPEGQLLWLLGDALQLDFVTTTSGGSFVARPLTPGTPTELRWVVRDANGGRQAGAMHIFTKAPMSHPVITEVLANPVGPEPDQEFVELYNDGLAPADLGDFAIEDIGGRTPLPRGVMLMPGRYALIVDARYDAGSDYDPAPADGTVIVRVDELGKNGLKNDGEPLKLTDASGAVVSRFPPLPKPKSGESVHRLTPDVTADDAEGFVRALPTPGAPHTSGESSLP